MNMQQLLGELVANRTIKARTKWKTIYPSVKDDERYHAMLGNPGSNPLELFWDAVDTLDQALDAKMAALDTALDGDAEVTPETNEEQWIQAAKGKTELSDEELREIFYTVRAWLHILRARADFRSRKLRKRAKSTTKSVANLNESNAICRTTCVMRSRSSPNRST